MVQLPDSVRPAVAIVVKYHFWMLAALVPLIILPLLLMANGQLDAQIKSARSQIDSRFSALRSVESQNPHPNEAWSETIVANTKRTKRETLSAWSTFWQSQAPLRQWPAALGPDFVQRAAALKPGGTLPRKLLERYQDGVRMLVRELPKRMGSEEHMRDEATDVTVAPVEPRDVRDPRAAAKGPRPLVQWNPEDQKKIYQSFNWEKAPSTTQVVMAQEELWVYGLLCDTIARMNRGAAGAYNAPIPTVAQLTIGYPAAEDSPGGSGTGRIMVPQRAGAPGMDAMPPGEGMPGAAPMGRPPHPRFGGGGGAGMTPGAGPDALGGEGAAASPDDALKNWVYVDFDGKPLVATDLQTNPAAQMMHLMPFVIHLQMDQRSLDALLVDLASSPIPIDVRQIRINAAAGAPGAGPGDPGRRMPQPLSGEPGSAAGDRPRLHDIDVEIRGTIALATPPDPKIIGMEEADLQDAGGVAASDPEPDAAAEKDDEAPVPVQPAEAAP